jgi:hypothetical protein
MQTHNTDVFDDSYFSPSYNVAPQSLQPVVSLESERSRWQCEKQQSGIDGPDLLNPKLSVLEAWFGLISSQQLLRTGVGKTFTVSIQVGRLSQR